ncbi:hypothetical protein BH11MYX4_BH11MYX4_03750 [soil metagenome]
MHARKTIDDEKASPEPASPRDVLAERVERRRKSYAIAARASVDYRTAERALVRGLRSVRALADQQRVAAACAELGYELPTGPE